MLLARVGKNHDLKKYKKSDYFIFFKIRIFVPSFYQIFETGLSAQSRK